jgi:uncharacterized delta-60 repeat protein
LEKVDMNEKTARRSGLVFLALASIGLSSCNNSSTSTTQASLPQTGIALLRYTSTGAPDTSFGGGGIAVTDVNPSQNDRAFAVLLQSDGKIIAVGNTFTTQASITVIRYNADGTLDPTFGSGGITVTSLPSADASAFAATLQTDGKVLVAGRSSTSSGSTGVLLLRYNTNGTLDTMGFGAPLGYVTTAIPSGTETSANAIALSGNNIVVAGHSKIGGKFAIALTQYTTSGVLDSTFGSGGIVTTQIGSGDADAAALAVQADGKIVAAGLAGDVVSSIWDVALLRYNTDGTLDLPFGGNNTGIVTTDIGSSSNYANAVALQGDGKIVVAGNAFADPFVTGTSDIAVLRYNTDGTLDTAGFGSPNGYVTTNVGAFDNGFAVVVQPVDGKIVVAGNADAGTADRFALLRYTADGGLDSGFGTSGIVTRAASGPSPVASANAVVLQPVGGAIVVAGYD